MDYNLKYEKTTYQFLSPLLVVSSLLVLGNVFPSHAKAGMVNINSTPETTIPTIATPSENKIDSEQEPLLPTEWTIDLPVHSENYSETSYAYKQLLGGFIIEPRNSGFTSVPQWEMEETGKII